MVIILAILLGVAYGYIANKMGKMNQVKISDSDLGISSDTEKQLSEYRNIAIFGVDSRADDYGVGNRSDCIVIASINNSTGKINLISVYRDTYVEIKGHGLDKITHAYSYGEAPLALNTLNTNLDLNIKEFVTVNMDSVSEIVDKLGGVKINISQDEIKYLNDYIDATSKITRKTTSHITTADRAIKKYGITPFGSEIPQYDVYKKSRGIIFIDNSYFTFLLNFGVVDLIELLIIIYEIIKKGYKNKNFFVISELFVFLIYGLSENILVSYYYNIIFLYLYAIDENELR